MSASAAVQRVVDRLDGAGYAPLEQPVSIGGIPFDFSAMLAGRDSLDLVVVADTVADSDHERLRRRVEGLARALDVLGSRRTLTVVVVGPRPPRAVMRGLAHVARVLPTGTPIGDKTDVELGRALAVLLPLHIDDTSDTADAEEPESWTTARAKLLEDHPDAEPLVAASKAGAEAVTAALREHVAKSLAEPDE